MTEPDPLLDELASAHLDGTASPEEVARVAGDPTLRARVDELRAVRAAVGAIPVVDPRRRDAAITAALAAYDEQPEGPKVRTPPVTSLAAVAARRRTAPVAWRLVGVAAAIVLLALLAPLVAGLGEGSDDDQAAETSTAFDGSDQDVPDSGGVEGGVGEAGTGAPESAADASTTTASARSAEPLELGRFDDLEALVDALERERDGADLEASAPLSGTPGTTAADAPCAATAPPGSSTARATLDGEPVLAVVTTGPDGARTLRIFAAEACTLLIERPL